MKSKLSPYSGPFLILKDRFLQLVIPALLVTAGIEILRVLALKSTWELVIDPKAIDLSSTEIFYGFLIFILGMFGGWLLIAMFTLITDNYLKNKEVKIQQLFQEAYPKLITIFKAYLFMIGKIILRALIVFGSIIILYALLQTVRMSGVEIPQFIMSVISLLSILYITGYVIYVILRYLFIVQDIVLYNSTPSQALQNSWDFFKEHKGTTIGIVLLFNLLIPAVLGVIYLFLHLDEQIAYYTFQLAQVITLPLFTIAATILYCSKKTTSKKTA